MTMLIAYNNAEHSKSENNIDLDEFHKRREEIFAKLCAVAEFEEEDKKLRDESTLSDDQISRVPQANLLGLYSTLRQAAGH
jgi:hypothetical protein